MLSENGRLKIALIGTRGVPAQYGGFETCVEEVGRRLAAKGHEVVVFCRPPDNGQHSALKSYRGMNLVHLPVIRKRSLETLAHTGLSVVHRALTDVDAAVVFNAANAPLLPVIRARGIPVATHVDGLEWRRGKWGPLGQRYYRVAEALAVRWSDALIADADGIADYYQNEFGAATEIISYGAPILQNPESDRLLEFNLRPKSYHLVVARFEPENHVLEIVRGYVESAANLPLVVVGSAPYADEYSDAVRSAADDRVQLLGGLWDQQQLDQLYAGALTYLHGHSVGGTNPSLLRAAGAGAATIAFDVVFNREVLRSSATAFFTDPTTLSEAVEQAEAEPDRTLEQGDQLQQAIRRYTWDEVAARYEELCHRLAERRVPHRRPSGHRRRSRHAPSTPAVGSSDDSGARRRVLVVNPSPDVYGADLQMLQAVSGMLEHDWDVTVVLPADGPLVPRIVELGADVEFSRYPVLRRGNASPRAMLIMVARAVASLPRSVALIRHWSADAVLVNTVTLPWWIMSARMARRASVVYVHEAETSSRAVVRRGLMFPLRFADRVIVISQAAFTAMTDVQPRLAERSTLIYNGVPGPPNDPGPAPRATRTRFAVIGRLSPRKAPHVAIAALSELVDRGFDVDLELAGTVFPGYEWYEEELRKQVSTSGLRGRVHFSGYQSPIWPVLDRTDVVLAPSLNEPFGNAVVEAQLARRPVIASASQGHLESVVDRQTGFLVPAEDAGAMAAMAEQLLEDVDLSAQVAHTAQLAARRRFSVQRYRAEVAALLAAAAGSG